MLLIGRTTFEEEKVEWQGIIYIDVKEANSTKDKRNSKNELRRENLTLDKIRKIAIQNGICELVEILWKKNQSLIWCAYLLVFGILLIR